MEDYSALPVNPANGIPMTDTGLDKYAYHTTPDMPIAGLEGVTIGHFRDWAHSNLHSNAERGVLAEFYIHRLLGVLTRSRIEWAPYDLVYRGYLVEVKCTGSLQTWASPERPKLEFTIGPTKVWDPETRKYGAEGRRWASFYVLCHYTDTSHEDARPDSLDRWEFYVVPTAVLDAKSLTQGKISLGEVRKLARALKHYELKAAIDRQIDGPGV